LGWQFKTDREGQMGGGKKGWTVTTEQYKRVGRNCKKIGREERERGVLKQLKTGYAA